MRNRKNNFGERHLLGHGATRCRYRGGSTHPHLCSMEGTALASMGKLGPWLTDPMITLHVDSETLLYNVE